MLETTGGKKTPLRKILDVGILVLSVTVLTSIHYTNYHYSIDYHLLLQFGYYIPVIYAALRFGPLGGIGCGLLITLLFLPFMTHFQMVNQDAKYTQWVEILLINGFGWLTGFLVDQERKAKQSLEQALDLKETLITQLGQEEQERRRLEEEIRQVERLTALGQLSAGLAHEIRNPLGIIKVTAQLLAQEKAEDETVTEYCKVLLEETSRLNRLLSDFLGFARPKELNRQKISWGELLAQGALFVEPLLYQKGILLEWNISKIAAEIVEVDVDQMKQVILNLLLNAIEAQSEKADREGKISIEGVKADGWMGFAVIDEGTGIPEEAMPTIFNPFYTTKEKGTGLGLSIVHRIVEQHQGQIALRNEPAGGVKVEVLFRAR